MVVLMRALVTIKCRLSKIDIGRRLPVRGLKKVPGLAVTNTLWEWTVVTEFYQRIPG